MRLADDGGVSIERVQMAAARIAPYIRRTPVVTVRIDGRPLLLKLETRQRTGSFKLRGALSAVSAQERLRRGRFYTASAGNHGLGAAAAALLLGGEAAIYVYRGASREKVRRIVRLGGGIIEAGRDYDEAEELAQLRAKEEGAPFLHPFDDPDAIAGQGTVALELLEQVPECDMLIAPVGGGGLLSGCAAAGRGLRPGMRIYGVQPAESPAMARSLEAGRVVETPIGVTACDALAGRFVSERTLSLCRRFADGVVTVSEGAVREAMRVIRRETGVLAEPSAAVGVAAVLEGAVKPAGTCAVIISGGNISRDEFNRLTNEEGS